MRIRARRSAGVARHAGNAAVAAATAASTSRASAYATSRATAPVEALVTSPCLALCDAALRPLIQCGTVANEVETEPAAGIDVLLQVWVAARCCGPILNEAPRRCQVLCYKV